MDAKHHSQGGAYRINLKLDPSDDTDIIAWLESFPTGQRSAAVREAIRRGLGIAAPIEAGLDLDAIRQVVADELSKSLASLRLQTRTDQAPPTSRDIESEYGSKLDRMLGELSQGSMPDPDNP
jgi:hypothetical protein